MNKDDQLDKEIEELESRLFNDTPLVQEEAITVTNEPSLAEKVEALTKELEISKKRFNNFKGSNDITTRDLRTELANSKAKYANLQKDYSDLVQKLNSRSTESTKIFSEEEIDILGEPAANALNKGVNDILEARMKPLQDEVQRNRKEAADRELKEAREEAKRSYDKFMERLVKAVPNIVELNVDPRFIAYIKEIDEYSGYPREYFFKKAEEALDVGRVASFFTDFLKTIESKEDKLAEAVSPEGAGGSNQVVDPKDSTEPVYTIAYINKFYDDFSRGKYNSKKGREEADRIERLIDNAVRAGRVRQ